MVKDLEGKVGDGAHGTGAAEEGLDLVGAVRGLQSRLQALEEGVSGGNKDGEMGNVMLLEVKARLDDAEEESRRSIEALKRRVTDSEEEVGRCKEGLERACGDADKARRNVQEALVEVQRAVGIAEKVGWGPEHLRRVMKRGLLLVVFAYNPLPS